MTVLTKPRMTVDEFLTRAMTQPERYELYHGRVYMMSPENAGHAEAKFTIQQALPSGIRATRLPCHALPEA